MAQLKLYVGDRVSALLDPAGPGTEAYRRRHGHECELIVSEVSETTGTFSGDYKIDDVEDLCNWLIMMDGQNNGEQIGDVHTIPDIPIEHVEEVLESEYKPVRVIIETDVKGDWSMEDLARVLGYGIRIIGLADDAVH